MPDTQAETVQQVNKGFITTGPVTISGQIVFGDYHAPKVLDTQRLRRIAEQPPSRLPAMLKLLGKPVSELRLLVLEAPSGWGEIYVAEHLARYLIDSAVAHPESAVESESEKYNVLVPVNEINGRTLLSNLKDHKHCVVLVENASADRYETNVLENLCDYCREKDLYIIFTTQDKHQKWDYFKSDHHTRLGFFELEELNHDHAPYSNDDLALWLCNMLNATDFLDGKARLVELGILAEQFHPASNPLPGFAKIAPTTPLMELNQTVQEITARLRAPDLVRSLPQRLRNLESKEKLDELINEIVANRDRRVKDWFDHLETEEAHYVVLALCLADNLPQETFWAIYEQLTKRAWRERHLDLRMTDYLGIQLQLREYVEFDPPGTHTEGKDGSPIRFINSRVREELITHALNNYRRSLVQALPILADLVTEQSTIADHSLVERLRELDIVGSELSPSEMNQQRRQQVRDRLIASIVEIQEREPQTAEHLLLTWAEGAERTDDDEISPYYQRALIYTLEAMYRTEKVETRSNHWYERRRSFRLLHRWYTDYAQQYAIDNLVRSLDFFPQEHQSAIYQLNIEQRRARVRASMTRVITRLLTMIDNDEWDNSTEAQSLLRTEPEKRPDNLTSLWHMLVSLAWDPSSQVRTALADALRIFPRNTSLPRFEALLFLLASDRSANVRIEVASLIKDLCIEKPRYTYLLAALLDSDKAFISWNKQGKRPYPRDKTFNDNLSEESLHLWTGGVAVLMLAIYDNGSYEDLLTTYLHTCVEQENKPHFKMFKDILERIIQDYNQLDNDRFVSTSPNRQQWLETLLKHILLDATGDNFQSAASKTLKMLIDRYGTNGRRMDDILSTDDQRQFNNFRSA